MDGWLCSYGRGPYSASVTMLGGPRTPADPLTPPNYLVVLMRTRRRTFIVERYFRMACKVTRKQRGALPCGTPNKASAPLPHMSQSAAAAVKNARRSASP